MRGPAPCKPHAHQPVCLASPWPGLGVVVALGGNKGRAHPERRVPRPGAYTGHPSFPMNPPDTTLATTNYRTPSRLRQQNSPTLSIRLLHRAKHLPQLQESQPGFLLLGFEAPSLDEVHGCSP